NNYARIAMMLGLPRQTHPRELVRIGRTLLQEGIAPKIVKNGPCKENVVSGNAVDLDAFPVPYWNRLDGGRYIITYAGVVSKDPESGVMNVGIYRGMIGGRDRIPILMWRARQGGPQRLARRRGGPQEKETTAATGRGGPPACGRGPARPDGGR